MDCSNTPATPSFVARKIYIKGAEKAIEFYCQHLNFDKKEVYRWGDMPESTTQSYKGDSKAIAHSHIQTKCGSSIFISEALESVPEMTRDHSILINISNPTSHQQIYDSLIQGESTIIVPNSIAFWGQHFFIVKDQFGVVWEGLAHTVNQ